MPEVGPRLDVASGNQLSLQAWETNAVFWDERMGEGNDFVEELAWPSMAPLLDLHEGERVLDVACGNGLFARRLAALGAEVVAFDFSPAMLERARARPEGHEGRVRIEYRVVDATDEAALIALGERAFDAAFSNMALMDIADVAPLFRGLARLLRPGGRFVFSVMHPAFNQADATMLAEVEDREGALVTEYSVRIKGYLGPSMRLGLAINGQPSPQPYFHRPVSELLRPAFDAGFVLDGLAEPAFGDQHREPRRGPNWNNMTGIPPMLVVRLRLAG